MQLNDYQTWTREPSTYPGACTGSAEAVVYALLLLAEEAGEVCGKASKAIRGDNGSCGFSALKNLRSGEGRDKVVKELGDTLFGLARVADELGIPLQEILDANVEKLKGRMQRGTVKGSGDDR